MTWRPVSRGVAALLLLAPIGCAAGGDACSSADIERIELLHAGPILPAPNAVLSESEIRHTIYAPDRGSVARTQIQPMPMDDWAQLTAAACAGAQEKTERSTGNTFIKVVRAEGKESTTYDAAKDDPLRGRMVELVERTFQVDLFDLDAGHGNVELAP